MHVETIVVGSFQVNCFVLTGGNSSEAIVIDPGSDADTVAGFIRKNKLTVACYLLTHGHVDHVSGLADLHDKHPAPIAMHPADREWAFEKENQMPPFFDTPRRPAKIERELTDGLKCADAGLQYKVISTPGHTPGSVCLYFANAGILFTGDTLFAGSVGRTDLPGGSSRVLADSLKKIASLPDATIVYPGHGPASDIGYEKETNYFLQSL